MEHQGTKTLETNRIILRKMTLSDNKDMFNNWASNPNVTKYMTWPYHKSIDITNRVINEWVGNYNRLDYYQWAIELKEQKQIIGTISVVSIKEYINECEIGYCIGEQWWNQGIVTEALKQVIDFLFTCVGAKRICACHDVNNPASGKVMIKNNMKYEGTFRKKGITSEGILSDLAYYSILKDEYDK